MLLSALRKKSFIFILAIFGLFAVINLAFPLLNPQIPTQNVTQIQQTTTSSPTSQINPLLYQSNSFQSTESKDLQNIILARDLMRETASFITCQIKGVEPIDPRVDCIKALAADSEVRPQLLKEGGMLYIASNAIGTMYTQPASSIDFTKNIASSFGINKANAQTKGTGFTSLGQIQSIWILFRNIAYLMLVIVFVIIGIAIMLRLNIDPRTVMSIQNQIPKAIVAIVMITFSYAIAGLLVDLMWVGTYFSVNMVTQTQPPCNVDGKDVTLDSVVTKGLLNNPVGFTTDILGDETGCKGTVDGISGLAVKIGWTLGDIVSRTVLGMVGFEEDLGDCGFGITGKSNLPNCVKIAFFEFIKIIAGVIAILIVGIAILIALFRVWFTLLKAYVYLIIDIVLAPFWIIAGLIPGSSLTFTGWVRNIFAQLAIFPVTALVLVLASIVAFNSEMNNPTQGSFLPPLIGNPNIGDNIGALMAFGLLLITPDLGNIVREALKSPASKATGGVTAMFGAGAGVLVGGAKGVGGTYASSKEAILKAGGKPAEERGMGKAILGRFIGH